MIDNQRFFIFFGIALVALGVLSLSYYINCRIKKKRLETVRNAVNNLTTADFEFARLNGTGVVNYNPKDEVHNMWSDLRIVDKRLVNDECLYIITCPPITYRYGGDEQYVKFSFENVNDDSGYLKVLKINENTFNEFEKVIKDCKPPKRECRKDYCYE